MLTTPLLVILLGGIILFPAKVSGDLIAKGPVREAAPLSGHVRVVIENFSYHPRDLTIIVGTTVTWINRDQDGHTVTEGSPDSPKQRAFDSSGGIQEIYIQERQTFSFTFTTPGVYNYYCIPHPHMRGTITVVAATALATTTITPLNTQEANTQAQVMRSATLSIAGIGLAVLVGVYAFLEWTGRKRGRQAHEL